VKRIAVYVVASSCPSLFHSCSVNDQIGLDPYCSYGIPDYLCDLETEEGLKLVGVEGNLFSFEGGITMILEEREELIDVECLDSETLIAMLSSLVCA
jgi:hypothetical protein